MIFKQKSCSFIYHHLSANHQNINANSMKQTNKQTNTDSLFNNSDYFIELKLGL